MFFIIIAKICKFRTGFPDPDPEEPNVARMITYLWSENHRYGFTLNNCMEHGIYIPVQPYKSLIKAIWGASFPATNSITNRAKLLELEAKF